MIAEARGDDDAIQSAKTKAGRGHIFTAIECGAAAARRAGSIDGQGLPVGRNQSCGVSLADIDAADFEFSVFYRRPDGIPPPICGAGGQQKPRANGGDHPAMVAGQAGTMGQGA